MSGLKAQLPTILAIAALTFACGDDGGGGGGSFSSGLDSSATLSSLTEAERVSFCEAYEAVAASVMSDMSNETMCTFMGAMVAAMSSFGEEDTTSESDMTETCEDFRDQCLGNPEAMAAEMEEEDTDCAAEAQTMANCEATVGQAEACMNDGTAAGREALKSLTCANAATGIADMDTDPASCAVLEELCPDFGE